MCLPLGLLALGHWPTGTVDDHESRESLWPSEGHRQRPEAAERLTDDGELFPSQRVGKRKEPIRDGGPVISARAAVRLAASEPVGSHALRMFG